MTTPAQKWAQKRNWTKFKVEGVKGSIRSLQNDKVITSYEAIILKTAFRAIERVLRGWSKFNSESKANYLRRK